MYFSQTFQWIDGRDITLSRMKLATMTDYSLLLAHGDTRLLTTLACSGEQEKESFLRLSIDYKENASSYGKIPKGFYQREGRINPHEILLSRLIDRIARPLLPQQFPYSIRLHILLLSCEETALVKVLASLIALTTLLLSPLPFQGPAAIVQLTWKNGKPFIPTSSDDFENDEGQLFMGGKKEDQLLMMEMKGKEIEEQNLLDAIQLGQKTIDKICHIQESLQEKSNTKTWRIPESTEKEEESQEYWIKNLLPSYKTDCLNCFGSSKKERDRLIQSWKNESIKQITDKEEIDSDSISQIINTVVEKATLKQFFDTGKRLDGRTQKDIRPISSQVGFLPKAHGDALFTRGETQVLGSLTLSSHEDRKIKQQIGGVTEEEAFIVHYNFWPFCVGDSRPSRPVSRREIGHSNFIKNSFFYFFPKPAYYNYTMRMVCDVLSCNGSSSMASVCATSLAFWDGGIAIPRLVAGIALGLFVGEMGDKYTILTDILGEEDAFGKMDFKIVGTVIGFTALQLDVKISQGISFKIVKEALRQGYQDYCYVIDKMKETVSQPRTVIKNHASMVKRLPIDVSKIGEVVGRSGASIKKIEYESGASLSIVKSLHQKKMISFVEIISKDKESLIKAEEMVKRCMQKPEIGKIYTGKILAILDKGALVEFLPGKKGFLHKGEVSDTYIKNLADEIHVSQMITVKLTAINPENNHYYLSRKKALNYPIV